MGYVEPTDLAAHVRNQVELRSPETTPRHPSLAEMITAHLQVDLSAWQRSMLAAMNTARAPVPRPPVTPSGGSVLPARLDDDVLVVTSPGRVALGFDASRSGAATVAVTCEHGHVHLLCGFAEAMRGMCAAVERLGQALGQLHPHVQAAVDHEAEQAMGMRRALELRRTRNTGPVQAGRAPRRIDPRRSR